MDTVVFKNKKWQLVVSRNIPFWFTCMDIAGQFFHTKEYGLNITKYQLSVVKNGKVTSIFSNPKNVKDYTLQLETFCRRQSSLNILEKKYYEFGRALLLAGKDLNKKFTRDNYQRFCLANTKLAAGLFLTTLMGRHFPELLKKEIRNKFPAKNKAEIEQIVAILTYPRKHSPFLENQLSLLRLGEYLQKQKIGMREINKNSKAKNLFERHYKRFSILPVNFTEDQWSKREILKQLSQVMLKDCQLQLKYMMNNHQARLRRANKFLREVNNKKIIQLVRTVQLSGVLNEYRKNIFCQSSLDYRPFFKHIARCFGLADWRDLWKLTPQEIDELYFNNNEKVLGFISERKTAGAISAKNKNGYQILSRSQVNNLLNLLKKPSRTKKLNKKNNDNRNKIQGSSANNGVATGVAKIIFSKNDFYKFKKGNILIAPMTSVDFIPIIKFASAIITDEGGLTCHAAIVSRELDIPCIVGTKIATQVLKDGDIVEVDADEGMVKILEK